MLTALIWIFGALACGAHMVATRAAVWLVGKGADNAWDNALGYLAVTTLAFWPARWAWSNGNWVLLAAIPLAAMVVHLVAIELIYEVGRKRAAVIGLVQLAVSSLLVGACALGIGVVAAYIMYGRIVSDPLLLLRIVLRLIGIEPPF